METAEALLSVLSSLASRIRLTAHAVAWWTFLAALAAGALTGLAHVVGGWHDGLKLLSPLAAVGFPAVGFALHLVPTGLDEDTPRWRRLLSLGLGIAVVVGATAALILHVISALGLEWALVIPTSSLVVDIGLIALGATAILTQMRVSRDYVAAQLCGLTGTLMGLLGLQRLLFGHALLTGPAGEAPLTILEAAGLISLGLAGFFLRPNRGLASVITSRQIGGSMARTVLPLIIGAPLAIAWLHLKGAQAGLFSPEPGLPVFAATTVVLALVAIWRTARSLNRIDVVRTEAEAVLRETTSDLQFSNEQLQRSEERLRLAIEGAGLATWHWNILTGSFSWSTHFQVLHGFPMRARVTRTMLDEAIHPDDRAAFAATVRQAIDEGREFQSEFRVVWPDGSLHWLASRGRAFRGDGGRTQRVEGISMDVTARRKAEEELRLAREQLEDAQARARLGSWSLDLATGSMSYSKQTYALLQREPAMGPASFEDFLNFVHPEDRARVLQVHQDLGKLVWPRRGEFRSNPGLGPVRYFSSTVETQRAPDGTSVAVNGTFLDVTEQRTAELEIRALNAELERRVAERTADAVAARERIQAVMDAATAVAIIATDLRGTITVFSRGAERMLGYTATEIIGRHSPAIFHVPGEIEALGREFCAQHGHPVDGFAVFAELALSGAPQERDWTYVRRDGSQFPVAMVVSPLHEHGALVGYLAVAKDMTERKAFEEQLRGAKVAAEDATRAKSDFLAVMSHEIRTPVNGVIGMTNLLIDSGLDTRQRQIAHTINSSAESLLSIINDVLDFSKVEARKLEFEILDFNLATVLEETIELLAPRAQGKSLELVGLIDPSTPTLLRGDPGRLRQVLTNLVANAIKFTEQGEVVVRVRPVRVDDATARLYFAVSDTGIGIEPEAQKRLFHAFTQADNSTTRRFGGTGLGLAICRQLVELMGGQIDLKSDPGSGSCFHFEVNLQRQAGARASAPAAPGRAEGARILVAIRNEALAEHVSGVLCQWRMAPVVTNTLEAALAAVADNTAAPFAVVIADAALDRTDPCAVPRRLATLGLACQPGCIVLTNVTQPIAPDALSAACGAIAVNKPVKQSELFDAISTLLGGDDSAAPETGLRTDRQGDARRSRLRILLAEDNVTNQQVALGHLEKLGCRADVVANGLEALEAIARIAYDVVLMDCMMPEMDGFAATTTIRDLERRPGSILADRPRLNIIALTANAMIGDRERCLAAGMDDYVSKPVRASELRRALDAALCGATLPEDSLTEDLAEEAPAPDAGPAARDPSSPPVDLDHLLQIFSRDTSRVPKVFASYLEQADVLHTELAGAVARRAGSEVRMVAHKWRGASANCGVVSIVPALATLERLGRQGELDAADATMVELDAAWEHARAFLSDYLHSSDAAPSVPARS